MTTAPLPPLDLSARASAHARGERELSELPTSSRVQTGLNNYCWPYQCSFYEGRQTDSILNGWNWEHNQIIIFFISGCGGLLVITLLIWLCMACGGATPEGGKSSTMGGGVNFETTLRAFVIRRLDRTHNGTKEPKRIWLTFLILIFLAVFLGLISITERSITFNIGLGNGSTFTLIIFLLVLWLSFMVVRLVRWVLYWLILGAVLLVFVDGHPSLHWATADSTFRNGVCSFILLMETFTIIIWLVERKLYPLSVEKDFRFLQPFTYRLGVEIAELPALRDEAPRSSQNYGRIRFYYRQPGEWPWRWFGGSVKRVASYEGEIDSDGRPHGYGTWQDSAPRGEHLRGTFNHGLPCGPFQSSETETGHGFSCVHIAFAHDRAEAWDVKHWTPKLNDTGLHWGIASVEACFAGAFFKHLPSSSLFLPPTSEAVGGTAHSCVSYLRRPIGAEVKLPSSREPFEAVLYVHGFASSLHEATLPFGQLLALAALPASFKPFIFSWPCGSYLSYFAAKKMAESEQVAKDLASVMQSLEDAGATAVHVIAYSLGAQLLLSALPQISSKFQQCEDAPVKPGTSPSSWLCGPAPSKAKLRMATCMLMSPDFPLDTFVNDTYYELRSICSCITLYADEQDVALAAGEFFNRTKGLSRYPFALVAPSAEPKGDEESRLPAEPPMAFERVKQEETPLDVDVINTSFLDANVPQLRHINLPSNVHVVDDLREIIVGRLRASQRRRTSRMIRIGRAANVYSFMAAPSHVAKDAAT